MGVELYLLEREGVLRRGALFPIPVWMQARGIHWSGQDIQVVPPLRRAITGLPVKSAGLHVKQPSPWAPR